MSLVQAAFSGLDKGDTVVSVLCSLRKAADLRTHFLGNSQTCGVVARAVDLVTGRKLFGALLKTGYVNVHLVVRIDSGHVVLYYHRHSIFLLDFRFRNPFGSLTPH